MLAFLANKLYGTKPPNTVCTRSPATYTGGMMVGVAAFSGSFCGLKLVPVRWHDLVPPIAANAHRSHAFHTKFIEANMVYNPEAVKNAYDEIAEREDQFEKEFSLRNEIPREFVKKYLKPSDVVLDAGGGSGINSIMMAQHGARVTLVDISPKLLELARTNIQEKGLTEKIDLREGDIANLEQLEDGMFNLVICLGGTLSYVLEKGRQAIRELVRVARRGAFIIIGCDSKYGFVRWLFNETEQENQLEIAIEVFEASKYEAGAGTFARLYTVNELTALLKDAGCEIIEVGSTPILINSWEQSSYPKEKQQKLKEFELKFCTIPELLGIGHHLFCVARKL